MSLVQRNFAVRDGTAIKNPNDLPYPGFSNRTIPYWVVAPLAMLSDGLVILMVSTLSAVGYHLATIGTLGNLQKQTASAAVVAVLFTSFAKGRGLYEVPALLNLKSQIRRVATKWVGVLLFVTAVAFALKIGGQFSRGEAILFAFFGLITLIGQRVVWRMVLADGLVVRRFSGRRIVLITQQASSEESDLPGTLRRHGLQLTSHFVLPREPLRCKQIIAQAIATVRGSDVEEIVVGADLSYWPELRDLLVDLRVLPLPVNLVLLGPSSEVFKLPFHLIGTSVTVEFQRGPRTLVERAIKRSLDILCASTALILLMPLFLMTAIAIRLDSPGPVLFRQWRCGFNGRPFRILKFRTMSVLEDGWTIAQATRHDERVTPLGKWLRRTSIDELPQLLNVLWGDMSIVGPRPHARAHDTEFDKTVAKYALRQHVKPGITGWAQVHGFRGRTATIDDIEQRVKFDLWYIENWSLAVDLRIMLKTVFEIMRGENAY